MPTATPARPPFDTRLTLRVLGGASLACPAPGAEPPSLGPGKPLALLVYLALAPERSATREHLLDLLWSDLDPDKGRAALRQTLYEIKRRLGDGILTATKESVRVSASVESDRSAFLDSVTSGDLERAVALYAGEFLPSFALPGGAEFEKWADAERFQLRSTFIRAGEALVRNWIATTRLRDAQELARRVRDADPFSEAGWRLVLETLIAAGDTLRAGVEADRLEQMLVEEGREAHHTTHAVLRLARQRRADVRTGDAGTRDLFSDLVGREREFATLLEQWNGARRGSGRHVHISAAAGLGKSRLLADLHARLRVLRTAVVMVRANPGERRVPYALATELASALCALPGAAGVSPSAAATLVDLCPALSSGIKTQPRSPAPADMLRHRLLAIEELVAVVAEERPLVILIDDLHWSDAPSHQLLEGVVGRLTIAPVLVVSAGRPVPSGAIKMPATVHIDLEPLAASHLSTLVASAGVLPDEHWARQLPDVLQAATGGNPLLVRESLHYAMDSGALLLSGEGWSCASPERLWHVLAAGSALRRRVDGLGSAERSLLLLLSLGGAPLARGVLAAATDRSAESIDQSLNDLEQRGFVTFTDGGWRPAHDEIASQTEGASSDGEIVAAHGALGRALADASRDDATLRRASMHLALAKDEIALTRVVGAFLQASRRRGDRRSADARLRELLAESGDEVLVQRVIRRIPLYRRIGLDLATRVAAAVAVLLSLGAAVMALSRQPVGPLPDATVVAIPWDSENTVAAAPLRLDGWRDGQTEVEMQPSRRFREVPRARGPGMSAPVAGPGGQWAYVNMTGSDSTGNDIVLAIGADRHRLTSDPRDDERPSFSPDGQYIAYQASLSSIYYHYDIRVTRKQTGASWWLTGPADSLDEFAPSHRSPIWSQDGSRIAYLRLHWDETPDEVCWTAVDRSISACQPLGTFNPGLLLGWYDDDRILVSLDVHMLARISLSTGAVDTLSTDPDLSWQTVSPNGRFALLWTGREGDPDAQHYVAPIDHPRSRKRLTRGGAKSEFDVTFSRDGAPAHLSRIEITAPAGVIPLDQTHMLAATGFDTLGRRRPIAILRWMSADTSVATIDAITGLIRPRRQGRVTVHASSGGWRRDSTVITIGGPEYRNLFLERWTPDPALVDTAVGNSSAFRWIAYGTPLPVFVRLDGGRRALNVNGNGNYSSGLYLNERVSGDRGIGVEAMISTPIVRYQWQTIGIELTARLDESQLASWDRRTGGLRVGDPLAGSCGTSYPPFERRRGIDYMWVFAGAAGSTIPADHRLASGAWYRLRLQIFPDGTCGVAIDGLPLFKSARPLDVAKPYRLVVSGNAAFAPMLVQQLEMWYGVKPDVDWAALNDSLVSPSPSQRVAR